MTGHARLPHRPSPPRAINEETLLAWLRQRRDDATEASNDYDIQGDYDDAVECRGRADAFSEVIQHITYGGAS